MNDTKKVINNMKLNANSEVSRLKNTAKESEIVRKELARTNKKISGDLEDVIKNDKIINELLEKKVAERTAELRQSYILLERRVVERTAALEDTNKAILNVLADLNKEKSKAEIARAKEKALLESIGEGMVATDQNGKIILVNPTAEKMFGVTAQQMIGKFFYEEWDMFDEKGRVFLKDERPISLALKGVATTSTVNKPFFYTKKNGEKFPVAINVAPVTVGAKIIGSINVFRDVTAEREIDIAKTEFVSLASHQLRTPLTVISWYVEMIIEGYVGDVNTKEKKYLDRIYEGNRRMVELVNTLLNVSRLELGTFNIELSPTNIVSIVQNAIDEQKPEIDKRKIIVTTHFNNNIPIISADPKMLLMVFQNILSNSIKYSPEEAQIEFSIFSDDKKNIVVKISDTGYGIPKNQQEQVFTKLFRGDNIRKKDINGTGLGLYIVKSIVERFGGKVWFESPSTANLGKESLENPGTTFYVEIPFNNSQS